MITLRPYQREAIRAIYGAFQRGVAAPLVAMPTGSGKAPTLCTFIKEAIEQWPDQRILSLVHVQELVAQNVATMLRIWPDAPVSVYSAGLGSRDLSGQVVMASIQSIYKRAYDLQRVDLIVADECHLIPPSGEGMYKRLLSDLAKINGGEVPMVGFTATPFRLSSGSLVDGKGRVFDELSHEVGLLELIEGGYLCPPVTKATAAQIDTSGVSTRGGEFVASQLQAAADRVHLTEAACDEICAQGRDRRSWLVFSTGVDHAFHIRDALRQRGISCETVTGETPQAERRRIVQAHKDGIVRCLTNDSVLTTGYDNPIVDLLAVLRPTQSPGLWVQMVGRGTRLAEGKSECLVLDFGGNALRHGPLDQICGRVKTGADPAPMKECPGCRSVIPAGSITCPDCGHEFEIERERKKHSAKADDAPLVSTQVSDWLPVTRVTYAEHRKPGSPPSLRVTYHCGLASYSEWICFEHEGFAKEKAIRWMASRIVETWKSPTPKTVAEIIDRVCPTLRTPTAIRVRPDAKYFDIAQVRF